MGLWHGVDHYEQQKIHTAVCPKVFEYNSQGVEVGELNLKSCPTEMYVRLWPDTLKDNTAFKVDWSYIVSWVGVGMTLCSSILFFLAAVCIKNDKEREDAMNLQYLMPGMKVYYNFCSTH